MRQRQDTSKPTTVLIVGDNAVIADLTLTVLSELGPSGITVPGVSEAMSYLNAFGADVAAVIADDDMEGDLTGSEFARFVSLAWPDIKVAITTSASAGTRPLRTGTQGAAPDTASGSVERFTSPILPLQIITFLENAARGAAATA